MIGKFLGWLLGKPEVVRAVTETADKAVLTQQERLEFDQRERESIFRATVSGANSLVRPGMVVLLTGGIMGWWELPKDVDPYWQNMFTLVVTFYFGGRALLKDLPEALIRIRRGR